MSERKFTRGLGKVGMAAQLRETVSQVVRETTVQNKPHLVEPIDFESFVLKNKTLMQNDPQRELLLYPPDDVSQIVLPRRHRTVEPIVEKILEVSDGTESLLTKECLRSYASNWNLVHYKYASYSGTYSELPKLQKLDELKDEIYEIDIDVDQIDDDITKIDGITKEGYLMKGPNIGISDRMFVNIGSKSFKRRFCHLRQAVDGTYILELFKDDKKGETKLAIIMDLCTEVIRNPKRGRYCFELKIDDGTHKSYTFAADNENDMQEWLLKLTTVLQHYKQQEEKRAASLERTSQTPPPSPIPVPPVYGTLKGLEQSMNPQLIKYSRETDSSILIARRENRKKLFNFYNNNINMTPVSKSNPTTPLNDMTIEPYKEQFGQRIFVKCETLKFRLQAPIDENETLCQVEPYQTTLCLFDARNGRKLSENFHFDINHEIVRDMTNELSPNVITNGNNNNHNDDDDGTDGNNDNDDKKTKQNGNKHHMGNKNGNVNDNDELPDDLKNIPNKWIMYPRQAIFSINNPHPDIFLVVRIEKILQGSICQTSEPYIRATKDPRLGLKVHKNVRSCCQRLGNYKMPFAWSARPLFRLYSNELDVSSDFPAIYRQEPNKLRDDDILKLLNEYRKPDKLSKLTIIPGWIKLTIEPLIDIPENTLTTSLTPLKPFPLPPIAKPTIEIIEFDNLIEKDINPYTNYTNHLYVYPQTLNFDTQKIFNRARNIALVVELREDDDCNDEKSLQCIYSKPGSNKILTKRVNCAVLHHNSIPSWYEEIKIRLPTKLHAKHHLLFSFYHISCDMNKKKDNTIENCVGYSWLLLLQKGKLMVDIDTNIQNLSVSTHLPPGYLSIKPLGLGKGNAGPDITWIDGQKQIFTVSYQLVSTVFTRDSHLHNFFLHAEKIHDNKLSGIPSDNETCKILKAAHAIQLTTAITFLPTILNQLFSLLTCSPAPSEQVGICIICLIIHLINLIHKDGRKDILKTYVKYVFVPPIKETTFSSLSTTKTIATTTTTVHEQLAKYLPLLLQPSNPDFLVVNKFMHHSWFFFDIMVKSMAQHMLISERIKMRRNERFPSDYHDAIKQLIQIVTPYLMNKYKDMPIETQELNKSLGLFLKKCLTFMDRGFVFSLINNYMDNFKPGDAKILHDFKFTFLQIICSHEHYILFNLPMIHTRLTNNKGSETPEPEVDDLMLEYCLSQDFCKHHFLVGLLLQEVKSSLNELIQTRKIAISTLRDLLAKHELDDRYQNKGQLSRIASIYIPWLGIVLDNLNRFEKIEQQDPYKIEPKKQNGISSSNSYLSNQLSTTTTTETPVKSINRFTLYVDTYQSPIRSSMHLRDSTYFAAIAGQSLENGYSNSSIASNNSTLSSASHSHVSQETTIARDAIIDTQNSTIINNSNNNNTNHDQNGHSRSLSVTQTSSPRFDKLQPSETKDILLCFLFVVKYLNDHQIIAWWQQLSDNELLNFFTIIEMSLYHFKYIGKRQITSSPSMINGKPKTIKSMTLPARMAPPDFTTDNNNSTVITTTEIGTIATGTLQSHNTTIRDNLIDEDQSKYHQALLDANMSTEIGLITLDCVGLFCIHFKNILLIDGGDNLIMEKLFNIYLTYLQIGQSETLLRHVFASLRAFLNNYSVALFQGNAIFCGRLCYELLRCCNSKLSSIRQESCALLYLLMRSNFEFTSRKGITRVHLQVIISVSQMLGNVIGLNNSRFQESLSLINSYASSDKVMKGSGFPVEVKDLNKRIRTVLMATAQMREHNNDPEMLVDLQHSLANSYASTPELRHTWLETMARNHARDGNFSEAACCQLHIAALMAEYLKLKNMNSWGAEAFDKISMNISKDERGLKLDAGVQDIHYNESILLQQLESCAEMLEKAERFEVLGSLYRLIIPIYENKRNYVALSTCYSNLNNACTKIVEVTRTGKRLLGRFYRVAFFGSAYFEDENCQEFIYKEPKVTSLSEISERLHHLYSDKFGFENVKMIMDSAPIDQSKLDQKIAYIQVTHVTPYFEKYELDSRQTEFEQNHDICWFMFETPFTNDGKPRGNPEEQWKRRTIIKTDYYFPYIKKRIKIIDKKVISLSPIEVALDEMRQRVQELEDVALIAPADAKKLQLRLQGSVCVTVNAGPLAYASAFLDPALSPQYPDDKVEELKDVFREFVKICYTALQINSKLITNDQQEYQEVLRENYQKFCQNLSSLLGESVWPDEYIGSFKRNSSALFSAISGTNSHTSSA